jgi:hypothetical protein
VLAGCSNDPATRKLRYLSAGERYRASGKYREAIIEFRNALEFTNADTQLCRASVPLARRQLREAQTTADKILPKESR